MADDQIVAVYGSPVSFAPGRLFDADAYPSAGAGMAGTAIDFLTFLETIRTRGGSILKPETVDAMISVQVRSDNLNQGPGWADRKSLVVGKSMRVRVDLGGRRIIKKKNPNAYISIDSYILYN